MNDSLVNFVGSKDPVFNQPFTVIDPQGDAWGIASDKIWFIAQKGKQLPRFKGTFGVVSTVLMLLKARPEVYTEVSSACKVPSAEEAPIVSILGVPVSQDRLKTLILAFPCKVRMWDSTELLGVPSLGFYSAEWRAFLMGYDNVVESVPEIVLEEELSLFDLAMNF